MKETNLNQFQKIEVSLSRGCLCIPSMEEEGEPEAVKLIWNIRVKERQQATHIIQTVDLHKTSVQIREYVNTLKSIETDNTTIHSTWEQSVASS